MNVIQIQLNDGEKIAFCGDIHIDSRTPDSRIDDLFETAIEKMNDILKKCIEKNVKCMFFEGDIFNKIQVPHICVNMFGEVLLKFKEAGIQLFTICGNHDILRNSLENIERSPIQTLFTFGILNHINLDNRVIINKRVLITPVDYTEYPPKAEKSAPINILLAHMFYNASELLADERHNLSKKDVEDLGYDAIFLGHDHEEYPITKHGKSVIVRSGSVLRGTSHNYNFTREPGFVVLHDIDNICSDTIEKVGIEHKRYEDIASSYVLNRKKLSSITGLSDVLSNLAEKLSEGSEADGDRIWDIINTDADLPADCRLLIMSYINENS